MKRAIRVYIAGPYSSNPTTNVPKAIEVADELLNAGFIPFLPHLSHYWDAVCPHGYETWMGWCLRWLDVCDCLFRIQGKSPGADREVELAWKLGKPIFVTVEDMLAYYSGAAG